MNSRRLKDLLGFSGKTDDFALFKLRLSGKVRGEYQLFALFLSYKIARYTDVFTDDVRDFYFEDATYRELHEKYGIGESVLKNNVHRQTRRYFEIIGRDLLGEFMDELIDDEEALMIVEDLQEKYDKMDKISVTLEDMFYANIFLGYRYHEEFADVQDDEFKMIRDVVARISKPAVDYLVSRQDRVLLDYVVYLLTTGDVHLNEIDRDRKASLIMFLRLGSYFNSSNE